MRNSFHTCKKFESLQNELDFVILRNQEKPCTLFDGTSTCSSSLISTFLYQPFSLDTSMVSLVLSHQ